jgi:phage-related protein
MRPNAPAKEKPLYWMGSSKRDLLTFPVRVVRAIGHDLSAVQYGELPPSAKPWKGLGSGVWELVEYDASGTYRAVYTVRFARAIYVLHAFQKKSPTGIRTARPDIALVAARLRAAKEDYEERYGEEAD